MGSAAGKGTVYRLNAVGTSISSSTPYCAASEASQSKAAVPEDVSGFSARWESVVEWESINAPASRQGMAMLLAFDRAGKCDAWLWRPLHYVALHGLNNAVHSLVEAVADVNARTGGHAVVGKKLTPGTFNFFVEIECQIGGKPIHVRAEEVQGNSIVVMKADDPTQRWSATLGQCRCVGYSPMRQPQHLQQCCSATPLHVALENRHLEAAVALLEQKADPNLSWNDGRNMPLHTAIWQGHYRAVSELLRHAADANAADCWHRSPLVAAALCPTKKVPRVIAVMLLESGAKRAATDNAGKTAAVLARDSGNPEFAETVETYVLGQWRVERPDRHFLDVTSSVAGSASGSAAPSSRSHGGNTLAFAAGCIGPSVPAAAAAAVGHCGLSPVPSLRLDGQEGSPFAAISYHPPKITGLVRTPLQLVGSSCDGGGAEPVVLSGGHEDVDEEDDEEDDEKDDEQEERPQPRKHQEHQNQEEFQERIERRENQQLSGAGMPAELQIASGLASNCHLQANINDAATGGVQPVKTHQDAATDDNGQESTPCLQSTNDGLFAGAVSKSGPTRIDTMPTFDVGPVARGHPDCSSPAFGNPNDGGLTLEASLVAACAASSPAPDDAPSMGSPRCGRRLWQGSAFPDLGRTVT